MMAEIAWQDVLQHIQRYNPHTGSRDAIRSIEHPHSFIWHQEVIQPDDPRIDLVKLCPISRRDVGRYMKKYQSGSDFPAVIFTLWSLDAGGKFSCSDGAHRLRAALNLDVPFNAFIGIRRRTS